MKIVYNNGGNFCNLSKIVGILFLLISHSLWNQIALNKIFLYSCWFKGGVVNEILFSHLGQYSLFPIFNMTKAAFFSSSIYYQYQYLYLTNNIFFYYLISFFGQVLISG